MLDGKTGDRQEETYNPIIVVGTHVFANWDVLARCTSAELRFRERIGNHEGREEECTECRTDDGNHPDGDVFAV